MEFRRRMGTLSELFTRAPQHLVTPDGLMYSLSILASFKETPRLHFFLLYATTMRFVVPLIYQLHWLWRKRDSRRNPEEVLAELAYTSDFAFAESTIKEVARGFLRFISFENISFENQTMCKSPYMYLTIFFVFEKPRWLLHNTAYRAETVFSHLKLVRPVLADRTDMMFCKEGKKMETGSSIMPLCATMFYRWVRLQHLDCQKSRGGEAGYACGRCEPDCFSILFSAA